MWPLSSDLLGYHSSLTLEAFRYVCRVLFLILGSEMEQDLNCLQLIVRKKCYEKQRGDRRIGGGEVSVGQGDGTGHANVVLNSQTVRTLSCGIPVVY